MVRVANRSWFLLQDVLTRWRLSTSAASSTATDPWHCGPDPWSTSATPPLAADRPPPGTGSESVVVGPWDAYQWRVQQQSVAAAALGRAQEIDLRLATAPTPLHSDRRVCPKWDDELGCRCGPSPPSGEEDEDPGGSSSTAVGRVSSNATYFAQLAAWIAGPDVGRELAVLLRDRVHNWSMTYAAEATWCACCSGSILGGLGRNVCRLCQAVACIKCSRAEVGGLLPCVVSAVAPLGALSAPRATPSPLVRWSIGDTALLCDLGPEVNDAMVRITSHAEGGRYGVRFVSRADDAILFVFPRNLKDGVLTVRASRDSVPVGLQPDSHGVPEASRDARVIDPHGVPD